jgi:CBS domain-containing protein
MSERVRSATTVVGDLAVHQVVTVGPGSSLRDCARAMREKHVGSLVIVEAESTRPVGIITDRDVVVEAVAVGLDPDVITAGDIAIEPLVTIGKGEHVLEAVARMRENGVRRLAVTTSKGQLVGVLSLDDLIGVLAEQLDGMARIIASERFKENATRSYATRA